MLHHKTANGGVTMKIKLTRKLRPNSQYPVAKEYMQTVFAGIANKVWIENTTSFSLGNQEEITVFCRPLVISGLEDPKLVNSVEKAIRSRSDLRLVSIDYTGEYQQKFVDMNLLDEEIYGVNAYSDNVEYKQQLKIHEIMSVEEKYRPLQTALGKFRHRYPNFVDTVLFLLDKIDNVRAELLRPRQKDIYTDIKKEIRIINKNFARMSDVVIAYSDKGVEDKRDFLELLCKTIRKLLKIIKLNSDLIDLINNKDAKNFMENLQEIISNAYKAIDKKLIIFSSFPTVEPEFLQISSANYVTPVWLGYPINLINTWVNSLLDTAIYYVTQHATQPVAECPSYFPKGSSCYWRNGSTLFSPCLMGKTPEPCANLTPNSSLSLT